MESRKIQKVGAATLTISLPKEWAEQRNLKKGDQVFLITEGESLKVVPAPEVARQKKKSPTYVIDADLCDEPGMLERIIVGNYVLGRERILVRSAGRLKGPHADEVRRASRRLMGLGIIEESPGHVTLQCSIDPAQYPIGALLKRLYNLGATMLRETIEALRTGNRDLAVDAGKREDDADMMYWLLLRLILSAQVDEALVEPLGLRSRLEITGDRAVAKELESLADTVEEMSRSAMAILDADGERPADVVRGMGRVAEKLDGGLADALSALLTHDLRAANRALKVTAGIAAEVDGIVNLVLRQVAEPTVVLAYRTALVGLLRIAEVARTIAVIAFNRYLQRPSNLCKAAEEPAAVGKP